MGGAAKRKLETLPDVLEADLHLELLCACTALPHPTPPPLNMRSSPATPCNHRLPCSVLDARELVHGDHALPRPEAHPLTPLAAARAERGAAARAERAERAAAVAARASFLDRAAVSPASDEATESAPAPRRDEGDGARYRGDSK